MQHRFFFIFTALWCLFAAQTLLAQSLANPVSAALSGVHVGVVQDVDAFGANPALFLPLRQLSATNADFSLSFSIGAVGAHGGQSAFRFSDFQQYLGKANGERRILADADLQAAASLLEGSRIAAKADAVPFAAVLQTPIGAFALGTSIQAHGGVQLPTGLSRLLAGYSASERLTLSFPTSAVFLTNSIHLGFAREIPLAASDDTTATLVSVRLGGSVQYCTGNAFEELSAARLNALPLPVRGFPTTTYDIQAEYSLTTRSAGTSLSTRRELPQEMVKNPLQYLGGLLGARNGQGFGVSLGGALLLRIPGSSAPAWTLAAGVNDIGGIAWNDALVADISGRDTIRTILAFADSTFVRRFTHTRIRSEARYHSLPTTLHIGFAFDYGAYFRLATPLVLGFQYSQGLQAVGFATTDPRLAIGLAWENIGFMPSLRMGLSLGGQEEVMWSGGLGWNIARNFSIDAALTNLLPLLNIGRGTWFGASLRLRGRIEW